MPASCAEGETHASTSGATVVASTIALPNHASTPSVALKSEVVGSRAYWNLHAL